MDLIIPAVALLGMPLFLVFFLKCNAGALFLAGCTGLVLLLSLDHAVISTAGAILPSEGEAYIRLLVVLLSIIFAGMLFRESVHGSAFSLHGLVALFLGFVLWLALPEATGLSWLSKSLNSPLWQDVKQFQALVVAAGFSLSLLVIHTKSTKQHKKH